MWGKLLSNDSNQNRLGPILKIFGPAAVNGISNILPGGRHRAPGPCDRGGLRTATGLAVSLSGGRTLPLPASANPNGRTERRHEDGGSSSCRLPVPKRLREPRVSVPVRPGTHQGLPNWMTPSVKRARTSATQSFNAAPPKVPNRPQVPRV